MRAEALKRSSQWSTATVADSAKIFDDALSRRCLALLAYSLMYVIYVSHDEDPKEKGTEPQENLTVWQLDRDPVTTSPLSECADDELQDRDILQGHKPLGRHSFLNVPMMD